MSKSTSKKFKYDVFISYSSKDKDWVRGELLTRIKEASLRTCIDFEDFEGGQPSSTECNRGVRESRKVVVVLTPNYIRSPWAKAELNAALTLSPDNSDSRVIPILKADCKKPKCIVPLTHIDFRDGADMDLAWNKLLIGLCAEKQNVFSLERPFLSSNHESDLEDCHRQIQLYDRHIQEKRYADACELFRQNLYKRLYSLGEYQECVTHLTKLLRHKTGASFHSTNKASQAWICNSLALSYSLSGEPQKAAPLFEKHNAIVKQLGGIVELSIGLQHLAFMAYSPIGRLKDAETTLNESIHLCQAIAEDSPEDSCYVEALGRQELGRLLATLGRWEESRSEIRKAVELLKSLTDENPNYKPEEVKRLTGVTHAFDAWRQVFNFRYNLEVPSSLCKPEHILESAQRAEEVTKEYEKAYGRVNADRVRIDLILGAAHRINGNTGEAIKRLKHGLSICTDTHLIWFEPDIRLEIARTILSQKPLKSQSVSDAKESAINALRAAERIDFVKQSADAHLILAQIERATGHRDIARKHTYEALKFASCNNAPHHVYKVAYEEAKAMLSRLNS
jgi:tetratricopeptide (TPR) repeat protein